MSGYHTGYYQVRLPLDRTRTFEIKVDTSYLPSAHNQAANFFLSNRFSWYLLYFADRCHQLIDFREWPMLRPANRRATGRNDRLASRDLENIAQFTQLFPFVECA